jgi:hypothetical protein
MGVSAGCCARSDIRDPNIHLAVLDLAEIQFEQVCSPKGRLLGPCELVADHAERDANGQRRSK